jgi:hypothetical protein
MDLKLTGKVAIVTGSTSGIGKAILLIGAVILGVMCSCAPARFNTSGVRVQGYANGVSTQKESLPLPPPKATTCFTHHVTDSAAYMQCF